MPLKGRFTNIHYYYYYWLYEVHMLIRHHRVIGMCTDQALRQQSNPPF